MKKRFFSFQKALALSVLLLFTAVMTGCKPDATETPEYVPEDLVKLQDGDLLLNDWFDTTNGRFIITKDYLDNKYLDYSGEWCDDDGNFIWTNSYAGNHLYVLKLSETSGTIFIKFTRAATPTWSYTSTPDEAPDVGKWYAISYKDLNSNAKTVNLSGAYKTDGVSSCNTLVDAVNEFTIENGYFGIYTAHLLTPDDYK